MNLSNELSFNHLLKDEICSNKYSDKEYKEIILIGLKTNSIISIQNHKLSLIITSFYPSIIRYYYQGIKQFFNNRMEIKSLKRSLFGKEMREYKLEIFDSNDLYHEVTKIHFKSLFCASVALFLLCGNISSPNSSNYNLYLSINSDNIVDDYLNLVRKTKEFSFKKCIQKHKIMLHMKKCEEISNFLKYICCFSAVFKFEDSKIKRDHLNNLNRLSNIDIMNSQKAIEANKKHIQLINKLYERSTLLKYFNQEERQIMDIKIKNDDLTLTEISDKYYELFNVKINKSRINNLIKKIQKILKI